jgi:hypothetical protein
MDIQGFVVMTEKEWKDHKALVNHLHKSSSFEVYVTTNDAVTFDNADDYFDSFEVIKLSDAEAKVFREHFKSSMSFWDTRKKQHVTLQVALNGTLAFRCPDEWEDEDLESEDEEENDEDDAE